MAEKPGRFGEIYVGNYVRRQRIHALNTTVDAKMLLRFDHATLCIRFIPYSVWSVGVFSRITAFCRKEVSHLSVLLYLYMRSVVCLFVIRTCLIVFAKRSHIDSL